MSDSEGSYLLEQAMFDDFLSQQEEPWDINFVPTTWTDNEGVTRHIKDMNHNHILNCIKWVTLNHSGPKMIKMVAAFVDELKRRNK